MAWIEPQPAPSASNNAATLRGDKDIRIRRAASSENEGPRWRVQPWEPPGSAWPPPGPRQRLAIVAGHPVQYISPWLTDLAREAGLELKVFYLWDLGVSKAQDPDFVVPLQWDIPLLEGYEHEFIANRAARPGYHHFLG